MLKDTKIENHGRIDATSVEEMFMSRAIELAKLGMGSVAPNPMVGCVIVHNGLIIGEGYHCKYGEAHAEVNAIRSVKNQDLLWESTMYVSLEPCSHFGKTPPCADLIVEKRIPKVVVGSLDPNEKVAGRGLDRLRNAGIEVITGIMEAECNRMNRRFLTVHVKKRPYIILKWAQTEDGFIDRSRDEEEFGQPTWITNDLSRIAVHKMRSDEAAILVGTNTALKDNPSLTVRHWSGNHPLRMALDRRGILPENCALMDQSTETIIFTEKEIESKPNLEYVRINFGLGMLEAINAILSSRGIQSLLVEGGKALLESYMLAGLWDEARVYIGNTRFGSGIKAPKTDWILDREEALDDSLMRIYYRKEINRSQYNSSHSNF
jgi:diaminohydroxyphosphoribosylaminopyrimidine deaminase/5-amino-6-(5-phosphoribosylamino)uracil reductase